MNNIDQWSRREMYSLTLSHTHSTHIHWSVKATDSYSDRNTQEHHEIWCNQNLKRRRANTCQNHCLLLEKKGVVFSTFLDGNNAAFSISRNQLFSSVKEKEKKDYVKIATARSYKTSPIYVYTYLYLMRKVNCVHFFSLHKDFWIVETKQKTANHI